MNLKGDDMIFRGERKGAGRISRQKVLNSS